MDLRGIEPLSESLFIQASPITVILLKVPPSARRIKTRAFAFGGIDALHKAGFQQPPAAEYTLVYDGELTCPVGQDERDILERIFARYNQAFPPDYHGRSIAPSDVLELYDESERRYFYCDMAGFPQVKFSPALAKKA